MYVVALTGGIGSGKTQATRFFTVLGVPTVDLDVISHALTAANESLVTVITSTFGVDYATVDGALDRRKMRQLIFNNNEARSQLNAILHPAIYQEAMQQIQLLAQEPYIILSIPLLVKDSPYLPFINRILMIDCDEELQIERVKVRSQLSEAEIKKIIATQTSRQKRLALADDVIENNGNIEELREKVRKLHQKYIKTCIVSKTIS